MKKKLHWGAALFALIWALALLLPPTRDAAHILLSLARNAGDQGSILVPPPSNDPIAVVWNLEREAPGRARVKKWNDFVALHPDQRWIMAAYLRAALSGRSWRRSNGLVALKPSDGESRRDAENAAILAAHAGQKEPNNAYWPWMEAGFRFVSGQRDQAMTVLERTRHASYFQDYNQSTLRARIHWFDQHARPTWEERQALSYGIFISDAVFMAGASEEAAHDAGSARTQGDKAIAIRIGATLLHANSLMRRDATTTLGTIIAQNTGYSALEEVLGQKIRTNGLYENFLKDRESLRKRWSQFARTNGRSDVATYANWLQPEATMAYEDRVWHQFGLSAPWGHMSALSLVFLWGVSALCFGFALLWLVGCLLRRGVQGAVPPRGQVALCANFSFWALVGGCFLLGKMLMEAPNGGFDLVLFDFVGYGNHTVLPILTIVVLALGCWLLPVGFANWKRGRRFRWVWPQREAVGLPRRFSLWRAVAWLSFVFFAAIVASDGNAMWDDTLLRPVVSAPLAILGLVASLILEVVRYQRTGRFLPRLRIEGTPFASPVPRIWRWLRNGAFFIAISGYLGFWVSLTNESGVGSTVSAYIGLLIGILGTLVTIVLSIKTARQDRFSLELARRTAGVLSLVCSFAFLFLAAAVWPLRIELNQQLDRRLNMREVDWMAEQAAKNPRPSP